MFYEIDFYDGHISKCEYLSCLEKSIIFNMHEIKFALNFSLMYIDKVITWYVLVILIEK